MHVKLYCIILYYFIVAVDKHLEEFESQLRLLQPRQQFTSELDNLSQVC